MSGIQTQQYRFPQGPMVDKNGYVTLEWQQWLQNPQFITALAGSLKVNSILNGQTNFINVCEDGEDGQDGYDGSPGLPGKDGENGSIGMPGVDGQDGEDYSFSGIPSTQTLTSINLAGNGFANDFVCASTSTATAGGTTTLVALSPPIQIFTGTLSQNLALPDATTLTNGKRIWVNNNSSGSIVIKDNGGTTIYTFPAGGYGQINLLSNATTSGTWDVHALPPSTVTWGSGITGLVFNTALSTTPSISAGASSAANPSFIPQRGSSTTGYGGDSTHLYGSIGGTAVFTGTVTTFNIPTGSTYQINGAQIAASDLSNGTTGSGSVVLATSPTLQTSATVTRASASTDFNINSTGGTGNNWTLRSHSDGRFLLFDTSAGSARLEVAPTTGVFSFNTGIAGQAFGCNGTSPQTAYASGGALVAYGAGANGFDTAAHAQALYNMVVNIRAALVANGIMS